MPKEELPTGAKAALPICLGLIPIGISYGLLALQAGLTQFETVLMSVLGAVIGQFLPEVVAKSFGVAFYASFLALLLPNAQKSRRVALLVLLAAGMNTVLQLFLPVSWAVILSMVASAAIGTFFVEVQDDEQN